MHRGGSRDRGAQDLGFEPLRDPVGDTHRSDSEKLHHVAATEHAQRHGLLAEVPQLGQLLRLGVGWKLVEDAADHGGDASEEGPVGAVAFGVGAGSRRDLVVRLGGIPPVEIARTVLLGNEHRWRLAQELEAELLELELVDDPSTQAGGVVEHAGGGVARMEFVA